MATIRCYDRDGRSFPVDPEALTFAPAVYGIFIENDRVLLMRQPPAERWQLPGGILNQLETPTQAVRHHIRNLTGITPMLGPLLAVEEQYHLDADRQAWHLSVMYYALDRPPLTATTLAEIEGDAEREFVPISTLHRQQLQFGYDAILAGQARLRITS